MHKMKIWAQCALIPIVAALRRGPPELLDLNREAAAILHDFENLMSFYSKDDLAEIREELKNVTVGFWNTTHNLTLPTNKNLPRKAPHRCALVSSGPTVLNATAGHDIDAVDGPVMRMNFAQTKGYEDFVGNRTEALVVNDQIPCLWTSRKTGPPAHVKMVFINSFGRAVKYECMKYLQEEFPKVPFFLLDYFPMHEGLVRAALTAVEKGPASLKRLRGGIMSTTGMIAGLTLMNLCQEVLHYGFLESVGCQQHYWTRGRGSCSVDPWHNITREHVLWKVISSTRGMKFRGEGLTPGWPRLQSGSPIPQAEGASARARTPRRRSREAGANQSAQADSAPASPPRRRPSREAGANHPVRSRKAGANRSAQATVARTGTPHRQSRTAGEVKPAQLEPALARAS